VQAYEITISSALLSEGEAACFLVADSFLGGLSPELFLLVTFTTFSFLLLLALGAAFSFLAGVAILALANSALGAALALGLAATFLGPVYRGRRVEVGVRGDEA
jgi:hypothetical protein